MAFRVYNTLTGKIEDFKPIADNKVTMYNCGPTVYDFVHIGNFRTYLMADFLRRSLEFSGYEVKQVKNITDVGHLTQDDIDAGEDKMLKAARRENKTPYDIARFYEEAFHKDEAKLNILPAHVFPRATEYVEQMIALIEKLMARGYAYEVDGSVYYDVDKFKDYGKLSGNTLENLKIGARLEAKAEKKNPYDFALWLKAGEEHLMRWQSPWSVGYPGWHIECSAMSINNLGETLDIHTGGEDNVFPHHEDEIAQSEGATGKKFVNYWLHGRHLLVDGEKMSKSKNNFYTIKDLEDRGMNPLAFRYLCLTAHFHSQLNFTWQSMEDSRNALEKLYAFAGSVSSENGKIINAYLEKFKAALEDNLNMPLAVATVWEMIKDKSCSDADKKTTLLEFDRVLGFGLKEVAAQKSETFQIEIESPHTETISVKNATGEKLSEEIIGLLKERETDRRSKDFAASDRIRDALKKQGYAVKDTPQGMEISKMR